MWTFLGIASFTYVYKKFDTVLTLAPREVAMAAVLFVTAGLLLTYIGYFYEFRLSQVVHVPLSILSSLPVIKHVVPRSRSSDTENRYKKVRLLLFSSLRLFYSELYLSIGIKH